MTDIRYQCTTEGVLEAVEELEKTTLDKMRPLITAVGFETVAFLRSLTQEMRPPLRKGENPRPAHPGHWADRTGHLARSYRSEREDGRDSITLVLQNDAGYAEELENRDGYWVLKGVAERDGPVMKALIMLVERIAPSWEIVYD